MVVLNNLKMNLAWRLSLFLLGTLILLAAGIGRAQAQGTVADVVVTASPSTINTTVSAPNPTNLSFGAGASAGIPQPDKEWQVTGGPTYTWYAISGIADHPAICDSFGPEVSVAATVVNPGIYIMTVGCSVIYTVIKTDGSGAAKTISGSGSANIQVNVGVVWDQGLPIGQYFSAYSSGNSVILHDGRLTAPQDQTKDPPVPAIVAVSSGKTLSFSVETATSLAHKSYPLDDSSHQDYAANPIASYVWNCSSGQFVIGTDTNGNPQYASTVTGTDAVWIAPPSSSTCSVTCTITDAPPSIVPPDTGTRGPKTTTVGCDVYVMDQVLVNGQKPHDVYVTIPADGTAAASVLPNVPGVTEVYAWNTANIYYAAPTKKGQPEVFAPATDGSTVIWNGSSASESYTATFNSVGHYIIEAACTISLEDNAGNVLWSGTGTGYIGGTQADVDGSNSSNAGNLNATVPPLLGTNGVNAEDDSLEASDDAPEAPGTPGKPGIHVKPLLRIKCDGHPITNNLKPFRVIRGKKVTLTVAIAPGLTVASGSWSISPLGSPVKSFGWTRPYSGMIATIHTTPLKPHDLTRQSISFYFTSLSQHMLVSYTVFDSKGMPHPASGQITAYDLKPTATDTIVTILPYYYHYRFRGNPSTIYLPKLVMAIPPTQVIYPFTPAPNVVNNANGAVGQATIDPFYHPFWSDYCGGGSIGDWGKQPLYWPDLNYPQQYMNPYPGVSSPRRMGANFNLGAMAANSGMNLQAALLAGEALAHFRHPLVEQRAIDAGYNWWLSNPRQPLSSGATISVHLPDDDTHNLN